MKRVLLFCVVFVSLVLMVGCGGDGDGGTGPSGNGGNGGPASGFTAKYRWGEVLGPNACQWLENRDMTYDCDLWFDWWTDEASQVDSVLFWFPIHFSIWTGALDCVIDSVAHVPEIGTKSSNHWKFTFEEFGLWWFDGPTNRYIAMEFGPGELVIAQVFLKNGTDSICECMPVRQF